MKTSELTGAALDWAVAFAYRSDLEDVRADDWYKLVTGPMIFGGWIGSTREWFVTEAGKKFLLEE